MHGRPRQRVQDPGVERENQEQAQRVERLLESTIRNHRERCYTKEALEQSARLVEINPDVYTAWNYRRSALKQLLDAAVDDEEEQKALVKEDLKVNEAALRTNIKCYGAWHHRKWLMALRLSSLDYEFALLKQLFKVDARNFHAWNYRRYLVSMKKVPLQAEIDYTTQLINENFSNYSAWHNRSALLRELLVNNESGKSNKEILDEEFNYTAQAFFIDPMDQSAWIYHAWLLHTSRSLALNDWQARLQQQIDMVRELIQVEEKEIKWAKLTLARLLTAADRTEHAAEVRSIFEELMKLDPAHREYYSDMSR